jgi:hypothetical protein
VVSAHRKPRPRIRCHLLAEGPVWALEETLFTLVAQRGVRLEVQVHAAPELEQAARAACARLEGLGTRVRLGVGSPSGLGPVDRPGAIAIWRAGVLATPDHFQRAMGALHQGAMATVAPSRRMVLAPDADGPARVVRKTRRWTSPLPSVEELQREDAFLARCLARRSVAPLWVPLRPDEHRRWAEELWSRTQPVALDGPPTVDLPVGGTAAPAAALRDALAEVRYQGPRLLERAAPLTFERTRRLFHRLRGNRGR